MHHFPFQKTAYFSAAIFSWLPRHGLEGELGNGTDRKFVRAKVLRAGKRDKVVVEPIGHFQLAASGNPAKSAPDNSMNIVGFIFLIAWLGAMGGLASCFRVAEKF